MSESRTVPMAEVYRRYSGDVFQYIVRRTGDRALSDDLTSETFLRAIHAYGSYQDLGKPVRAWLVTIARNLVSDHLRSAHHRRTVAYGDAMPEPPSSTDHPEQQALLSELSDELKHAMSTLPAAQRQCLYLRFYAGKSVSETARLLDKNDISVRAIQYRGTTRLRDRLAQLAPPR